MPEAITRILNVHPFTEGLWAEHIARLGAMASEVHFRSGELIFQEGDQSNSFYLLDSGTIALEVLIPGRAVQVSTLFAGEVLGWSAITGESDGRHFQARALQSVDGLAFDGARLRDACQSDYAFGFWLTRAVLKVMAGRLHAIRCHLLDIYAPLGAAL